MAGMNSGSAPRMLQGKGKAKTKSSDDMKIKCEDCGKLVTPSDMSSHACNNIV